MTAGAIGAVADIFFRRYDVAEATSFLFGGILLVLGVYTLAGWSYPGHGWFSKRMAGVSQKMTMLMMRDRAWPAFLFGFFTLALPCGQTLVVFSACALSGDMMVGLLNGFAFALLTTPSLFLAMQAHAFLKGARHYYKAVIGASALLVGTLAILRGLAEAGVIPHWVVNADYHIVIF